MSKDNPAFQKLPVSSIFEMTNKAKPRLANPVHLLAFGFGTGVAPFAPGTVGTLVGVLFFWLLGGLQIGIYIAIISVMYLLGIWLCDKASKDLGVEDHPGIVWDEIVGYLVTMIGMPVDLYWMLAGFLLFRLFDIWKPWPIRFIDKNVKGGSGIMLDDLLAAGYALLLTI
jgi:phosphatidylglycerophosphatase A